MEKARKRVKRRENRLRKKKRATAPVMKRKTMTVALSCNNI